MSFLAKHSKLLWFYGPILMLLLVNLVMFIKVVKKLIEAEGRHVKLNIRRPEERSARKDRQVSVMVEVGGPCSVTRTPSSSVSIRFLIYLKLFVGMGFIWTFEILAGIIEQKEEYW